MKKRLVLLMTAAITMAAAMPAYAGTWQQDATGWWWQNDDNRYPTNRWEWLDGNKDGVAECYYFDQNGYLVVNAVTPDSFQVNGDGAWVVNGTVQTQAVGGEKTLSIPDNVTVDENGTTVEYINGIPYYTYAKEEPQETNYEEIDMTELAYRVIEMVNEERAKAGREELAVNEELMENADVRAEEASQYFRHTRLDGSSYKTAITVDYVDASENLVAVPYAKGASVDRIAYGAVDSWLFSSGHKANMLNSKWDETGIGIYMRNNGFCIVQMFIKN